ncbi:Serine/threonine-protein kinase WNK8 [Spatholobus suberectus]|nr:Serine/threonine-protein kinase WNK8 [Spatholobus suberectus]
MKTIYEDLVHSRPVDGDDQEKQESVMSDISVECGIAIASDSKGVDPDIFIFDECWEVFDGFNSNSDVGFCRQEDEHKNQSENSAGSLINSCCSPSKNFDIPSTCSLTLVDKDHSNELQLELEAIETQYQQCFRELVKMREEAMENAKRRWITRKKIPVM